MGNTFARPTPSVYPIKKHLDIGTHEHANLIDFYHATMFPEGQETLGIASVNKVPASWHTICDLNAYLKTEQVYAELVLSYLSNIEQSTISSNKINGLEDGLDSLLGLAGLLIKARNAKDLQSQLLKLAIIVSTVIGILEVISDAVGDIRSDLFTSHGYYLELFIQHRIILEHYVNFSEPTNSKIVKASSPLFEFLKPYQSFQEKDTFDFFKVFKDFLLKYPYQVVDVPELDSLGIKLEATPKLYALSRFALAKVLKSAQLFLSVKQIVSEEFGGEVEYLLAAFNQLPEDEAVLVAKLLVESGQDDLSVQVQKMNLKSQVDVVKFMIEHYCKAASAETVIYYLRRRPEMIDFVIQTLPEQSFVGLSLYELEDEIDNRLNKARKWDLLIQICEARFDYRNCAKYSYLNYVDTLDICFLKRTKEYLLKLEKRYQTLKVEDLTLNMEDLELIETEAAAKRKLAEMGIEEPMDLFSAVLDKHLYKEAFELIGGKKERIESFFEDLRRQFEQATEEKVEWTKEVFGDERYFEFDQSIAIYRAAMFFIRKLESMKSIAFKSLFSVMMPEDYFVEFYLQDPRGLLNILRVNRIKDNYYSKLIINE